MYITEFTVTGRGYFPLDMLRYDACFPKGSDDVAAIENMGPPAPREVTLLRYSAYKADVERAVTIERWRSFGWTVLRNEFTPTVTKA